MDLGLDIPEPLWELLSETAEIQETTVEQVVLDALYSYLEPS